MGSINSRPKTPPVQTYVPVVPSTTSTTSSVQSEPIKTEEQIARESRTESLLRRSRGRLGTILTSVKGFFFFLEADRKPSRKTLLGE